MYFIIFLHTKTLITTRILTFHVPKRRGRFFELFESGEERTKDGGASTEGFEQLGGGHEKLVSCRGRIRFVDEQTEMEGGDRRASVDG